MATINLNKKKMLDEDNIRVLANLIVSLSNKQSSIENKCIKPWVAGELYQKNVSFVSFNNYIWFCTVTNNDTEFTKTHWVKLADEFKELSKEDIESLINLSPEQIISIRSLIDDTGISTTHTNSSSKIYMDIQAAIAECKDDAIKQIAKKVSGSYKIGNSISDVTSAEYIYLIKNESNYDLYVLVDGVAVKVGDTSIDLSEYLKSSDAESTYLKKTDAEGNYATIDQMDNKVDKSKILSIITNTATNEQLFGAKAIYDTFNLKAEKVNIFEIPDESGKSKHVVVDIPSANSISGKTTRLFLTDGVLAIGLQTWENGVLTKDYRTKLFPSTHVFVNNTTPKIASSKISFSNTDSNCSYCVIDGICYVDLWSMSILSNLSVESILTNLPTSKVRTQVIFLNATAEKTVAMGWIPAGTGKLDCNSNSVGSVGYATFSYPVMEDWEPTT